jgi:hypothetical protein
MRDIVRDQRPLFTCTSMSDKLEQVAGSARLADICGTLESPTSSLSWSKGTIVTASASVDLAQDTSRIK